MNRRPTPKPTTATEARSRLYPARIPSILGDTWVLRRTLDDRIEFDGFESEAEAVEFARSLDV